MDKKIIEPFKKIVGAGEKIAPLESIKLKAKFATKAAKSEALKKKHEGKK